MHYEKITVFKTKYLKMRIIVSILLLVGLMIRCDFLEPKTKIYQKNKGKTLEEIITNELATNKRNDTIFLNFRFGMSEKEFKSHLNKLIEEKKLYKDPITNFLTYDLVSDQYTTIKCTFSPEYYEGKLYKLGVSAKAKDEFSTIITVTLKLFMFYMNKYGLCDVEEKMELVEDCKKYIWIHGNRMISVMCGFSDSRIFYEDLSITSLRKDKEKNESKIKTKESLDDI